MYFANIVRYNETTENYHVNKHKTRFILNAVHQFM